MHCAAGLHSPHLLPVWRDSLGAQNERMEMTSDMMGDAIDDAMEVRVCVCVRTSRAHGIAAGGNATTRCFSPAAGRGRGGADGRVGQPSAGRDWHQQHDRGEEGGPFRGGRCRCKCDKDKRRDPPTTTGQCRAQMAAAPQARVGAQAAAAPVPMAEGPTAVGAGGGAGGGAGAPEGPGLDDDLQARLDNLRKS